MTSFLDDADILLADEAVEEGVAVDPDPDLPERPGGRAVRLVRRYVRSRGFGWTALAAFILYWQLKGTSQPSAILPAPTKILSRWYSEITDGELAGELGQTMVSMAYGYVIAAVVGITIGVLMGRVRFIHGLLEPVVEIVRPVPIIIFIPVVILYMGLGRGMNIMVIVLAAVNPVLLNSFAGARVVPATLADTAATFRLSWFQTLRETVLPNAAPHIFVGLRLALASSLIVAVATGMIAGTSGLGYYILNAQQTLNVEKMYAGALTVAIIGYGLNLIFLTIERRILHWHLASGRAH
ncbi:MAG: ABC transporter permease [Acidimicrobiia bacterium]